MGRLDRLHTFLTACRWWHVEYTGRNFWASISLTARTHCPFRVDCSADRCCGPVELHRVDFGHSQRRLMSKEPLRTIAGAVGLLFGVFLLAATMPMFHVGLIYKAVTLVWVFMICRHFVLFFRNSPAASRH